MAMMKQNNPQTQKDCLKHRYVEANLATEIQLEKNRLKFLQNCLSFKRPPQSLRVKGLNGLGEENGKLLVQEIETKALRCAIADKEKMILDLEKKLKEDGSVFAVDVGLLVGNKRKLNKKLEFYRRCEYTKWKDWKKKLIHVSADVPLRRKEKRKYRNKLRKLRKKESKLLEAARYAIENNLVRNLSGVDVPLFSIGVLSYGPGWIPTPEFDNNQFNVDALNAANKQVWSALFKDTPNTENIVPLPLLKNDVTTPAPLVKDYVVNQSKEDIINFASNVEPKRFNSKLNRFEREGLQWLKSAVKSRTIAITLADKGGCILIVKPELIVSSTKAKLMDTKRYVCLGKSNPLPELRKEMLTLWKFGVLKAYVTPDQAKKTVGLIYKPDSNKRDPFSISTHDKFKPGISYPYPSFKIHKLSASELEDPDVKPPVRLVTDLHDGVTSRSDKFVVWKWLAPLCKDYATDLVKDSSEALLKLDEMEKKGNLSDDTLAFGLDVVSLYDSLKFSLVKDALNDAMNSCRPEWDDEFRQWLVDLVISSFESAVVNFRGVWYGVEEGIATGGVPSVSAANISVYFVFKQLIYSQDNIPLIEFLRFVDDGLGFFTGSIESFNSWFSQIRCKSVELYGLDLTMTVNPVTSFTQFLDIRFKFLNGRLTTDIFRKETDANRYLSFNSCHPRHMFRSIIYTQGLRYRRIINDNLILENRLKELKSYFISSSYPEKLINAILDPLPEKPRILEYAEKKPDGKFIVPWVVTYGPGYDETKQKEKDINELLSLSGTWKETEGRKIVQVVPRRGKNLKDLLFRRKSIALTPEFSGTYSCEATGCQTCGLVSNTDSLHHRNADFVTAGGCCKSCNVIYCFQCKLCEILYVGKTSDPLHVRVNGHRSKFYEVLGKSDTTSDIWKGIDDEQIVGAHLALEHNLRNKKDFNKNYRLFIMAHTSPSTLRKTEQFYIKKLKTLRPYGLNQNNSVGDA